jgi:hypothetical protein
MKQSLGCLLLVGFLLPMSGYSQLNNGGLYANFGVDADTRTNYLKYGLVTGAAFSDDWFAPSGAGHNVIDTTNAATYLSLLQSGANVSFTQRMSQLLYAKVNGKLWLDAAYGRDYTATASAKDSTVFGNAAKNGDDPNSWQGSISSVPSKNDLMDVYAHMRRDGLNVHDSLWFFGGLVAFGNAANSYYNIELYKKNLSYNGSTRIFSTAGTSGGHTEWNFDAAGNITQTGDMIVAISFAPGQVPTVDVRIWVSQATFTTYSGGLTPKYFNFAIGFSSTSGVYGYASILSKTGSTAFGAAISNYSGTALQDTTYNTPWGSSSAAASWSMLYQHSQFIEVGLNMTRIGIDPALYSALNPCQSMFSNIFFASRSSSSFSSNLQDFVIPLTFLRPAVMDYSKQGDTLRCNHVTGMITLTDQSTAAYYSWTVAGGGSISGSNSDSSELTITKAGTYIVSSSPAQGCPTSKIDTIVVPIDTFPPIAVANAGLSGGNLDLFGADVEPINHSTLFGGSAMSWSWTGPGGFVSGIQSPATDTLWGTYDLLLTKLRNGCTSTASTTVLSDMFTALVTDDVRLQATPGEQQIDLSWEDINPGINQSYTIERSNGGKGFEAIGAVGNDHSGEGPASFHFPDIQPAAGTDLYRIKVTGTNGIVRYSATVSAGIRAALPCSAFLSTDNVKSPVLVVKSSTNRQGVLVIFSRTGEVLSKRMVAIGEGVSCFPVGVSIHPTMSVGALYVNGQIVWCQQFLQ